MEKNPSWNADWFSSSQEINRVMCIPKVHYRIYKWASSAPNLSQINLLRDPHSNFPKILIPIYAWPFQVIKLTFTCKKNHKNRNISC